MFVVDEIRASIAEIIEIAKSGHPGSALSLTPLVHILFTRILKITVDQPKWMNRDIFVLSNGHACPLVYCCVYLLGYLEKKDLYEFRTVGSRTPGHPEISEYIEAATGPLGQGIGQSVGYAVALKSMQRYNRENMELFNGRVYCIAGDGCMEEGVSFEALSLAGHLSLDNLTLIYDCNRITIDGDLSLSSSEKVTERMSALGFEVYELSNGEDMNALEEYLNKRSDKPIFILLNTVIAKGSIQEGNKLTHGVPLAKEDIQQLKEKAKSPKDESIWFSKETQDLYRKRKEEMKEYYHKWKNTLEEYKKRFPKEYKEITEVCIPQIPPTQNTSLREAAPTTAHLHFAMKIFAEHPRVFGGSADLAGSTKCRAPTVKTFSKKEKEGTFLNFGIREHGMLSILSGIAGYGWHFSFGSTFLNFVSYGFPALRIAAMSSFPYTIFASHDSIGLGQDGPSHQPVEMLALLRATPNIVTFRPCDGIEVLFSTYYSLFLRKVPTVISLTRQRVLPVSGTSIEGASRGGYIVKDYEDSLQGKKVLIVATGSEVSLALQATALLPQTNTRVVSLLSFELFNQQPEEYITKTLQSDISISIEGLSTFGWDRYAQYHIGLDEFGGSGPGEDLFSYFGFTPDSVAEKIMNWVL